MSGTFFYLLTALSLTSFALYAYLKNMADPREPPTLTSTIPFVGHAVGLTRRKFDYYLDLSRSTKLPIFTLLLPGQKMYVVTQPDLVQLVQKQHKVLSFTPIESKFAAALFQPSQTSIDILNLDLGNEGHQGIHADVRNGMREGTAPGVEVDQMNREMIRGVSRDLDQLAPISGQIRTIDLYAWIKEKLLIATTDSVYGSHNPYQDPDVVKDFWQFEEELMKIILLPQWLARGPAAARDRVAQAFERYYANGYHEQASLITRIRWGTHSKNGIPLKDVAKFEVGGSLAFLVNTIPIAFWFLFHIYSQPGLLNDIRQEIDSITRVSKQESGAKGKIYHIDVTSMKADCPILLSAYRETLRHHAMGMSVRQVTEDVMLADTYLLKAGAMIQMPTRVIHKDTSIWGSDVDTFRPRRFMKGEKHATPDGITPKDVYFRAFGGGKTLCPGRHFATNEVMAFAATFVARFDMRPKSNGGAWVQPTAYKTSVAAAVMTPDSDIEVEIFQRAERENGEWKITLTDSDLVLDLTAEDHTN